MNSKSDKSGTANKTNDAGNHRHSLGNQSGGQGGNANSGYLCRAIYSNSFGTPYSGYDGTHSHEIYLGSDNTETRPSDFTYKIWVRTA